MSDKTKRVLSLIIFGLLCWLLGMYTISVKEKIQIVEPFRWIITSLFGLYFFFYGINEKN